MPAGAAGELRPAVRMQPQGAGGASRLVLKGWGACRGEQEHQGQESQSQRIVRSTGGQWGLGMTGWMPCRGSCRSSMAAIWASKVCRGVQVSNSSGEVQNSTEPSSLAGDSQSQMVQAQAPNEWITADKTGCVRITAPGWGATSRRWSRRRL